MEINKLTTCVLLASMLAGGPVLAEKKYGPGVTDTEIKIGQTMPYSGPLSGIGTTGRAELAYFAKVNAEGGVNGRKIMLISLDDGYSPPKTVEQVRRLVEQDEVLAIFHPLGTPTNAAIHKYLNQRKVPHLFLGSGLARWGDPKTYPWTMPGVPIYRTEARIYGRYLLSTRPDAKIAVLYQNDDAGKEGLSGLKEGLGNRAASMIVSEASYEVTDPTVDSQVITLKGSGADTFLIMAAVKAAAQALRKAPGIGWKPLTFLPGTSSSIEQVIKPAGPENAIGVISTHYRKDPGDSRWKDDPGMKEYFAFMKKYYADGDALDMLNAGGYTMAQLMIQVLKQCGDDLTRENVMRQAASLNDLELPLLLPGIRINTSATDYFPIEQLQMMRFDGTRWALFGEILEQ
jgi:ABC-type branched-subunit amino acid transport system substrate-binding protein